MSNILLFWFGTLGVGLNFEVFYFKYVLGRLILDVVFISTFFLFWFGFVVISVRSPELQFKICERSGQFKIWGKSDDLLLRSLTFDILRSSSIWGCLHFKYFLFWFGPWSLNLEYEEDPIRVFKPFISFGKSPELKFKILLWSEKLLVSYSTSDIFMSSSTEGRLHLKQSFILVWFPKLIFKICRISG